MLYSLVAFACSIRGAFTPGSSQYRERDRPDRTFVVSAANVSVRSLSCAGDVAATWRFVRGLDRKRTPKYPTWCGERTLSRVLNLVTLGQWSPESRRTSGQSRMCAW